LQLKIVIVDYILYTWWHS